MSSERKESKASRVYSQTKRLMATKPELSWLGDHRFGLNFDQYMRACQNVLDNLGIDIKVQDLNIVEQTGQFQHEKAINIFAENRFDLVSILSTWEADQEQRESEKHKERIERVKIEKEENGND